MQGLLEQLHDAPPHRSPFAPRPAGDASHEAIAMALHDLGGLLTVVHGTVELWRRGARLHATPAEDWANVQAASGRAAKLCRELLDLCQNTHTAFKLNRRPMDLVRLVADVVKRHQPAFESAGRRLLTELQDAPICLTADSDLLERVFDNLLDNAAKYTEVGGHVTVCLGRSGDEAVVRIRDTGIGIQAEFLPRVFDPFARENHAAVRSRPGSGVGLLAVRRIVELHRGRVEAASPGRGQGSDFTVRLPIGTDNSPAEPGATLHSAP